VKRFAHTFVRAAIALWLCAAALAPAHAHKASDAYLQLKDAPGGIELRVDVALRDLDVLLDLDSSGDAQLSWGEVKAAWPAIDAQVLAGVQVAGCDLRVADRGLERRNDGAYAVLHLASGCRPAGEVEIRYTLLRETDPTHRGILRVERAGAAAAVRVLDPSRPGATSGSVAQITREAAAPSADIQAPATAAGFLQEGIHHIVTGYDHVLFLMCLLLPSVMRRERRSTGAWAWKPVGNIGQALLPVAGIVTAFTVAHSITLGLAALKLVSLPASFIEPAIAITIVLAALDNLVPIFRGRRVLVTFLFGLIHGFGFAGVLGELNLPAGEFAWALLQFNLGIELGQLTIVLVAAAVLYLLRERRGYPVWAIRGGSMAAIAVGVLWFIERTADVSLLPL
jgi:hypothetical protein